MSIDSINPSYKEIVEDVTSEAIYFINSTPKLYTAIKANLTYKMSIKDTCINWASHNNNEFGRLFQTELDMVNWDKVESRI